MSGSTAKVAIVTGGAQGIGAVFARRFAESGYGVVIADILTDRAQDVAGAIRAAGGTATGVAADVSDEASTRAMAEHALRAYGRIDVLINNAARKSGGPKNLWEIPVEDWDELMAVNVRGVWLAMRAVVPAMRQQGTGSIINMGSSVVLKGMPNFLHYAASKGAVAAMTRCAASELAEYGIRVNAILPGFIRVESSKPHGSEEHDPGRLIKRPQTPEDLVGAALFLASEASSYMTGQALDIDGGLTFI